MSQIIDFDSSQTSDQKGFGSRFGREARGRVNFWRNNSEERDEGAMHEFWPEVYCPPRPLEPTKPENLESRVLTELLLLLAVVGLMVLAVNIFVPAPF